ncbi:hypothetical protein B9G98_04119 [Wickerhamiella sorbophila]|uniref:37S ribosomal protein PET123, mitochondrial n=1 Tax=Wickerhamiella sorbophila TaxID=45607 RepID=A0A2T0FNF7_9ASCO|nr:hypothetical protein B9G98_04119 [Wickerhamiella sorbophila]PRT56499.1 hypothetical protein B9G98_04119 [Wickerhamiella sorbophila]
MKGIAKYGFKSGVLPKPRQIVPRVKPAFELAEEAKIRTGFADPKMVPKGSSAVSSGRKELSASEKIALSAKAPKKVKEAKTAHQEWRQKSADIRRRYLTDALETEEVLETKKAARRQKAHDDAASLRERMLQTGESEAIKLTMPTIENSLLSGSMVRPRTEEEKSVLALKRGANRKAVLAEQMKLRSAQLLELYQSTREYIITPEELDLAVDQQFSHSSSQSSTAQFNALELKKRLMYENIRSEAFANAREDLANTLLGTTSNHEPGLTEVRDVLDGTSHSHHPTPTEQS